MKDRIKSFVIWAFIIGWLLLAVIFGLSKPIAYLKYIFWG